MTVAMTVGATKIQILHDNAVASMSVSEQAGVQLPVDGEPDPPAQECPA
jgi:hypothetical protein